MKIVIDADIPFIRGRLEPFAHIVYADQAGFTPDIVADADALIIRTRTRCNAHLLAGSKVRLIATATIGMDQFDLPWCAQNGIITRNAPGCNAPAVAQYVWSTLLRSGFDPKSQTLGIVGYGHVGSIVADWGRKMGCRILVNDPPRLEAGGMDCPHTALHDMLPQCDAVTLHTPMTRTGRHPSFHLIGAAELALMRPGATLVNAARGPVADNAALAEAIASRGLHAIIDTWEGEPGMYAPLLERADIATFHIAGYSLEGKQRATRMALEAVGDTFGLPIDLSGLEGAYRAPERIEAAVITESFDPMPVDSALRAHPEAFDRLRAEYILRPEPRFM